MSISILTAKFLDWLISQFSLDKALMFGGQLLEGVDETGIQELGCSKVFKEGEDVLLLGESPHRSDDGHQGAVAVQPGLLADAELDQPLQGGARHQAVDEARLGGKSER